MAPTVDPNEYARRMADAKERARRLREQRELARGDSSRRERDAPLEINRPPIRESDAHTTRTEHAYMAAEYSAPPYGTAPAMRPAYRGMVSFDSEAEASPPTSAVPPVRPDADDAFIGGLRGGGDGTGSGIPVRARGAGTEAVSAARQQRRPAWNADVSVGSALDDAAGRDSDAFVAGNGEEARAVETHAERLARMRAALRGSGGSAPANDAPLGGPARAPPPRFGGGGSAAAQPLSTDRSVPVAPSSSTLYHGGADATATTTMHNGFSVGSTARDSAAVADRLRDLSFDERPVGRGSSSGGAAAPAPDAMTMRERNPAPIAAEASPASTPASRRASLRPQDNPKLAMLVEGGRHPGDGGVLTSRSAAGGSAHSSSSASTTTASPSFNLQRSTDDGAPPAGRLALLKAKLRTGSAATASQAPASPAAAAYSLSHQAAAAPAAPPLPPRPPPLQQRLGDGAADTASLPAVGTRNAVSAYVGDTRASAVSPSPYGALAPPRTEQQQRPLASYALRNERDDEYDYDVAATAVPTAFVDTSRQQQRMRNAPASDSDMRPAQATAAVSTLGHKPTPLSQRVGVSDDERPLPAAAKSSGATPMASPLARQQRRHGDDAERDDDNDDLGADEYDEAAAAVDDGDNDEGGEGGGPLVQCPSCGRNFLEERLAKHEVSDDALDRVVRLRHAGTTPGTTPTVPGTFLAARVRKSLYAKARRLQGRQGAPRSQSRRREVRWRAQQGGGCRCAGRVQGRWPRCGRRRHGVGSQELSAARRDAGGAAVQGGRRGRGRTPPPTSALGARP